MAEALDQVAPNRPEKAIPKARDGRQSLAVAWILALLIAAAIVFGIFATGDQGGRYKIVGISFAFAAIVAALRSATPGGTLCGALACFCITWWTRDLESPLIHSALPPLMILFALTFAATRAGRKQKQRRNLAERSGGRTSAQVMANLGAAALIVTPVGAYASALAGLTLPIDPVLLSAACVAALAEATADTVSSEIGQAFSERTYMLTSLHRVHRGTDGGISILGTSAGAVAALLVVLVGAWSLRLPPGMAALAFAAGLIGLFADSLLGATVERRGWIGNDVVNLTSTIISALTLLVLAKATSTLH